MITSNDVRVFMQKMAEAVPTPAADVKPDATATGAKGAGSMLWGAMKGNPLMWGLGLYGIGSQAIGAYGAPDEYKKIEQQLAAAVPGINTLYGRNPFTSVPQKDNSRYGKDLEEQGPIAAEMNEYNRQRAAADAKRAWAPKAVPVEDQKVKDPIDYTMVRKFQKEHKTDTVPVKRYQRG
jgi:hypothetical protein